MRDFLESAVIGFNSFVIIYFLALNSLYLLIVLIASRAQRRAQRMSSETALEDLFANPLTPGVSVLVPAYNEEPSIVSSVHSILDLRYPQLEVVIVDDGSTDGTFDVLQQEFELQPSTRVAAGVVETVGEVNSVHISRDGQIVVIRKENAGAGGTR